MKKLTEEAVGGLSAGIVGTVIGYPLDLIKTRMQTSSATQHTGILRLGLNITKQGTNFFYSLEQKDFCIYKVLSIHLFFYRFLHFFPHL
jgi:hypothetical protein